MVGQDTDSEEALAELRREIDSVKQHFLEERAAAWTEEERKWEQEEMEREMGKGEEDEEGDEVEEFEKREKIVPGAVVIEDYDQRKR